MAGLVVGAAAVWANAGKANIVIAAAATLVAAFAPAFAERSQQPFVEMVTLLFVSATFATLFCSLAWGQRQPNGIPHVNVGPPCFW